MPDGGGEATPYASGNERAAVPEGWIIGARHGNIRVTGTPPSDPNPRPMKAVFPPFLFLALAAVFASCDAVTGPTAETGAEARVFSAEARVSPDVAFSADAPSWSTRGVAVCHLTPSGHYRRIVVPHDDLKPHLAHGDELPGGAVFDAHCAPVQPVEACPCFTAEGLGEGFAGAPPQPYVFFDVFSYYSEDPRRTEVRSTLSTEAGLFEEVAAVYITPTGDPAMPLAPLCFHQDVVAGPVTGEPVYTYDTVGLTIGEAEGCRRALYAFAESAEPCQGAACGIPYTDEQLDPDYPPYHDEGFRTPDSVLDAMRAKIDAVRRQLAPPA